MYIYIHNGSMKNTNNSFLQFFLCFLQSPSRSTSTLRFRYFVTFIDDYCRCTWLFLMKTRVELFSIFQKFHAEICTQFNTYICILRSDNAKEYFSTPFSSFMSSHGILHQSSYAYTLQQNEVAECKNRYLVETTHTLVLRHNVPLRFWGDAILAACYFINRMSSFVLHDQIPHSVLLINLSFASLLVSLVVSVLFIFSLLGKTNSQPKPRIVFLGYSCLQRGYRCYSPDTNRYFISADVTFFEDSTFSSATRPSISEVLSIPLVLPSPNFPSPPIDVVT